MITKNVLLGIDVKIFQPQLVNIYGPNTVIDNESRIGAFVEILPGKEGLIHISEIDITRINKVTDVLNVGDLVDVIVKKIDAVGKIGLSRKEYLLKNKQEQIQN